MALSGILHPKSILREDAEERKGTAHGKSHTPHAPVTGIQVCSGSGGMEGRSDRSKFHVERLDFGKAAYPVIQRERGREGAKQPTGWQRRIQSKVMRDCTTNQQWIACGFLAPKIGKPWECTDGLYLASAETSLTMLAVKDCDWKYIPSIVQPAAIIVRPYHQHHSIVETLCSKLPAIAEGHCERTFKMVPGDILDAIIFLLDDKPVRS
eukprot:gene11688-6_t